MIRCARCVMPATRPDLPFDAEGVCAACRVYENRPAVDWDARKAALERILEENRDRRGSSPFDCIVPSSGGKDSHYQVLKLIELGARPLVVTATTCYLTPMGRANIDNLARYATTVEVTPNRLVRAKLNRIGLEEVGDISWPEHVSIFTTPFRVAAAMGIKLLFYGENPQNQYGGPGGTEAAEQLTRRWRAEFGGFLGLRPRDMVGKMDITERDMADYEMPAEAEIEGAGIHAYFLGQFFPWDSHHNALVAKAAGMLQELPSPANWWPHENLDCALTGLHDHFMYRKYGFGRMCSQMCVDIRSGRITRELALAKVQESDGEFPTFYAGVHISQVLKRIGTCESDLQMALDAFTNWDLFTAAGRWSGVWRPTMRE